MFRRDVYREVLCVLKMKCDVCACLCVLCVVHARKINVTCLLKVLSKNGSRGQKYTRVDAFSAVCPPDVLYLLYRFCFSLFLSLSSSSSRLKVLYNPRAFFTHAALLDQGCPHCPIFPTAASRRSLGRVSVPVWLIILSDQL